MADWLLNREPALLIALIDAILVLAVTFGLPLSADQKGAIDAVLAAAAGVLIRSQVVPTRSTKTMGTRP